MNEYHRFGGATQSHSHRHTRAHTLGLGMWVFNCRCWCCSRMIPCTLYSLFVHTTKTQNDMCICSKYMWKHLHCMCTCVSECIWRVLPDFDHRFTQSCVGCMCLCLDLTIFFFFYFKYIFILLFSSFNSCSFCPHSRNTLQTISFCQHAMFWKINSTVSPMERRWWRKKWQILSHLLRHIRVFKRGENGVNVWTSIFSLICIWFNFSSQSVSHAVAAFIPFWNLKYFAIKIIWWLKLAPKPFVNGETEKFSIEIGRISIGFH